MNCMKCITRTRHDRLLPESAGAKMDFNGDEIAGRSSRPPRGDRAEHRALRQAHADFAAVLFTAVG